MNSHFACLRKPKDLQTTDHFFMGNNSIIWRKIDWLVNVIKKTGWYCLIVGKGYSRCGFYNMVNLMTCSKF